MIFKDWISTVEELSNPEDIGVGEMNMHLARYFSSSTKSKKDYKPDHWNVSQLPSVYILVMANVHIFAIVSTIENYENRTVTPNSVSNNSTVTNNSSVQQTVIDLVPMKPNSRITLFPSSNIQGNVTIHFMAQMIRIGTVIYIEKWCFIAVINMVNSIVDCYLFSCYLYFDEYN